MKLERTLAILFFIFGLFFLIVSLQMESRPNVAVGPNVWPIFLMVMMIILAISLFIRTFRKNVQVEEMTEEEKLLGDDEIIHPQKFYYLCITLVVYIAALNYLGFILSTLICITIMTALFGLQKWVSRIITSIVSTACFILLFPILLQTPFPRGVGVFRTISLLFY